MAAPGKAPTPADVWTTPLSARVVWRSLTADPPVSGWSLRWRTAATVSPPSAAGQWQTRTGLPADARAHTIDGLDAGAGHDVELAAVNADGPGGWSDTLTVTTQEDDIMGILQSRLTSVAAGVEPTYGTAAAATRSLPYLSGASVQLETDWETLAERGTVRAERVSEAVARRSMLVLPQHLSPEAMILPLLCSLADVSSTAVSGARRWRFRPAVTAVSGLSSATFELAATDGAAAAHTLQRQLPGMRCTALSVSAEGRMARLEPTWHGRRAASLATRSAVASLDGERWLVPSNLVTLDLADSWGSLGSGVKALTRSLSWQIDPGLSAVEDAPTGRADLDLGWWLRNLLSGTLRVTADHDDDAGDEFAAYEAGTLRYARIEATNGQSGAALRRIRIDSCVQWTDAPNLLEDTDDSSHQLSLSGELRADSSDNFVEVEIMCGITSW